MAVSAHPDDEVQGGGAGAVFRPATEEEQLQKALWLTEEVEAEELVLETTPGAVEESAAGDILAGSTVSRSSASGRSPRRRLSAFKGEGAECSICFAPLPSQQVCVLIRDAYGKARACRHYFHLECVRLMVKATPAPHVCPLCRSVFERVEPLPDVRLDSAAWFRAVDADAGGSLEKAEVVDALSATLPVEPELLANSLEGDLWRQWTTEGDGRINRAAFEDPASGLLSFVLYSLPSLRRQGGGGPAAPVPDLVNSREGWFRYWDEDCEHALEFLQLSRALVRTLRIDGSTEDASVLRGVLLALWREFGLAGGGSACARPVSMKLFCEKSDGFCDALIQELQRAFGAARFQRMRQRAQLLQEPAAGLRRELRRLGCAAESVEKEEIVEAILNAQEAHALAPGAGAAPPAAAAAPARAAAAAPRPRAAGALRALSVRELQGELRGRGVDYGHCLERRELEELLAQSEAMPRPAPAPPRGAAPGAAARAAPPRYGATTAPSQTDRGAAEEDDDERSVRCLRCALQ